MITLSDANLFDDFLNTHLVPNTRRAYQNDLQKLREFLRDKNIPSCLEVGPADLSEFLAGLLKKYKTSYVIHIKTSIRAFYEYLNATERIGRNPASIFSSIRIRQPERRPRALSTRQRDQLAQSLRYETYGDLRMSAAVLLGLQQGLRVSEMVRLKWEAVDFEGHTLRLIRKGDKEKVMPMTASVATALRRLKEAAGVKFGLFAPVYVFPRPGRRAQEAPPVFPSTIQKMIKRAARRAELEAPISVHVLRHTFATQLVESGVDILTVSYLMGHSSIRTTQVYIRENPQKTADELKRVFVLNGVN